MQKQSATKLGLLFGVLMLFLLGVFTGLRID
jgi:hypothetical protein